MDAIERWTIYVCDRCEYMASNTSWHGCVNGPSIEGMQPVEVGRADRADAYEGAVRALDEILAAINELENEDALDAIVRIVNDARSGKP
jgi:hypothetical protein